MRRYDLPVCCEMATTILRATHDGNDLDPTHLWLVQEAANDGLSEKGWDAFDALYRQVQAGPYHKPWLHGIEGLTCDHAGHIYWKGESVEHFNRPWSQKNDAVEVARRCRILEARGETISAQTVAWQWVETEEQ